MSDHPPDAVSGVGLRADGGQSDSAEGAATGGEVRSGSGSGPFLVVLPWLLALGVAITVLLQSGTPALDIARYGAYWCFGLTLPGLLVVRATIGTRGNWPEDIALGAVTGLALELACFVLWSVLGFQRLLWLWPLLVVGIFAAVPSLRQHWRIHSPRPLPRLWSWTVAFAIGICTVVIRQPGLTAPLPPAGGYYYPDTMWHLSIVEELTRSFPPQIPQVSGEFLRYHWFSHVHLAAAQLVSGAPATTVVLRLWILPLVAVTALIGARLAMELSGTWWSGPVAAWTLLVFTGTGLLPVAGETGVILPQSPSQVFVLPLVLGAALLIVRALRGIRLGAGWVLLVLLLIAAAGAKPTAMPLVLAGTCLAGLVLVIQRRRQWLAALSVVGAVAVILPVSLVAVAGSDSRSPLMLFNFVEWNPLYHSLTGATFHPAFGPILPSGLQDLSGRSLTILVILMLVPVVANLGRLVPFAWLGTRALRGDPAAWFMAGVVIAGWGVYFVLSHPAYSQAYFLRLANPVASVFGAWALVSVVPATTRPGRRLAAVLAGGTLIGFVVVGLARLVTPTLSGRTKDLGAVEVSFLVPLAVLGLAVGVGILTWVLARRRLPSLRGWGSALALAALILGAPAQGAINPMPDPRNLTAKVVTREPAKGAPATGALVKAKLAIPPPGVISPDAARSMAWVSRNTPQDAVLATNRHCISGPERPWCQSTAFWVSGLGGRSTVIEGWGYTQMAKTANHPTPFPGRLAVNDAVFTRPSASTMNRLRKDYGVSWLVADSSSGPVSAELGRFADKRFSSGPITVYKLR